MSNYREHKNAGIMVSLVMAIGFGITYQEHNLTWLQFVICILSTFLFSLFPDVDIKSKVSKRFYWAVFIAIASCYIMNYHALGNVIAMVSIFPQLVKHRGIMHSTLFALGFPLILLYGTYIGQYGLEFGICLYIASVFGYLTHLVKDVWDNL